MSRKQFPRGIVIHSIRNLKQNYLRGSENEFLRDCPTKF